MWYRGVFQWLLKHSAADVVIKWRRRTVVASTGLFGVSKANTCLQTFSRGGLLPAISVNAEVTMKRDAC